MRIAPRADLGGISSLVADPQRSGAGGKSQTVPRRANIRTVEENAQASNDPREGHYLSSHINYAFDTMPPDRMMSRKSSCAKDAVSKIVRRAMKVKVWILN